MEERVREDASGDSEYGEDDEMACVIGESAEYTVQIRRCVWCIERIVLY